MKFFKVQLRNSLAVSHKTNGNPHKQLSVKYVVTLLVMYMPNKEQSFWFNYNNYLQQITQYFWITLAILSLCGTY